MTTVLYEDDGVHRGPYWQGVDGKGKVALFDKDGNGVTSTTVGSDQALDVNVVQTTGGGGGGTEFDDGDSIDTDSQGTLLIGTTDVPGTARAVITDDDGHLQVDVLSGGGGGTQYTEGDTDATITGTALIAEGAADNLVAVRSDDDGAIHVSDGGNALTIDGNVGILGTVTIDGDSSNITVDNAAGASAVNIQDGGNSITIDDGGSSITVDGTVSVSQPVSVDDNGGSLTVDNSTLSVTGGGTEAAAMRVTLANDSTGVVSVDDNGSTLSIDDGGGSITVDGTVSVSEPVSVDDNGGSLTVDNAALSVTGGGTEASAMRVTLANDSTGVVSVDDNGGTLTVDQTTASNLNVQAVGEVAHDAADSGNPQKVGAKAFADDTPQTAVAANDRVNLAADLNGRLWTKDRPVIETINLTALEDTYDNVTTANNSADFDVSPYRRGSLCISVTVANTPTDIRFILQEKVGSAYFDVRRGPWVRMLYDDGFWSSTGDVSMPISVDELPCSGTARIRVETSGTSASNTFEITDAQINLRN